MICPQRSPFPGNGISRPETKAPKRPPRFNCPFAETEWSPRTPPIGGYSPGIISARPSQALPSKITIDIAPQWLGVLRSHPPPTAPPSSISRCLGPTHVRTPFHHLSDTRRKQCRRIAVVLILIVRFHHVENHRLYLLAGGHHTRGNRSEPMRLFTAI
jgi:hypothetical protein